MFGLACTMLTAIFMVHVKAGDPFVARGGGRSYELAALYLGFAVMMILTGPGKLSIDARLFARRYDWIDRR
jgi:putative oxidoreductase